MKLDIAINVFINEKECFSAEKTIKYYKENLQYFTQFLERMYDKKANEISIHDIKHTDYNLYVKELRTRKKINGRGAGVEKLSHATVKHYADPVRYFFRYLYDEELIESDLAKKMKTVAKDKKIVIPLFRDEIEEIDRCFNLKTTTGLRNYLMFHMMLECGMRISETLDLKIQDVYFDKNFIHIKDSKHNKDRVVPSPTKLNRPSINMFTCIENIVTMIMYYRINQVRNILMKGLKISQEESGLRQVLKD